MLVAAVLIVTAVGAQSKLSNSTRSFLADIRLDTVEQQLSTRSLVRNLSQVNGQEAVMAFVHFYNDINTALLEEYGVKVDAEYPKTHVVSCRIPLDAIEKLSQSEEIRYVEMGTPVYQRLDKSRLYSDADDAINGTPLLKTPYRGKDVVVGVVDGGFQYDHAAFYDRGQNTLRVKRVWNQNRSSGTPPDGYTRGSEYKTESDIKSVRYDDSSDDTGHGTHVAGIAAGADLTDGNPYYGLAQESDLVLVSYYLRASDNVDIANGVKYVFEYADEVKKPAVVNLSLGSHKGPHDGTSTFDRIIDGLVGPGRLVVGAAGNEAESTFHVHKDFDTISNDTLLRTFVKFTSSAYKISTVDMWGDTSYSVRFVVYNNLASSYGGRGYLYTSDYYPLDSLLNKTFTVNPKASYDGSQIYSASIRMAVEKNPFNDKYHASLDISAYKAPSSGVYLGIEVVADTGTVHMWADAYYSEFTNNRLKDWDEPSADYGVGEIGGTAKSIICVGAYVSNRSVSGYNYSEEIGEKAYFSSIGPTADGRVKPDVSAPGAVVASAVPNTRAIRNSDAYLEANVTTVNGVKNYYAYKQGTSMASPYVTGTVAIWLQANPQLTYDEAIDVIKTTSIRDEHYGDEMPNNRLGWGRIHTYNGLLQVLGLLTSVDNPEMPASMVVYPNPTSGELNVAFARDDNDVTISLYSLGAQLLMQRQVAHTSAGENVTLNLDNIDNGAYVVRVQGSVAAESYRIIVNK